MPNRKPRSQGVGPPRLPPSPPDIAAVSARLRESAAALGVSLDAATADRLVAFGLEILRWSARVDLVSPTDLATLARRHLLDALALLPLLRDLSVRSLTDLGSGAGLPGLALAVADPALTVHSVEPRSRRAAFQRHAARLLGLRGVRVVEARVELGKPPPVPPADAVVARAVAPLPDLLAMAAPLARRGGVVIAMRGPADAAEDAGDAAAAAGLALERTHAYSLPGDERDAPRTRAALVYRRAP